MSKSAEDWKDEEAKKLRETEERHRDEVNEIDAFDVQFDSTPEELIDNRDFVDCCFFDHTPGRGVTKKPIGKVQCPDNKEPKISKETLCIVLDYKIKRTQGKRDPLAGNHLIHIPTPKGPICLPLHLAKKFFLEGLRAMDFVEDKCAAEGISMEPPGVEE